MKRYKSSTPRAAFALAAVAMTAMTLVVSVVVPATMDSSRPQQSALAWSNGVAPTLAATARSPAHSDALAIAA